MLGHRLRRWPNIKPTLRQRLVCTVMLACLLHCRMADIIRDYGDYRRRAEITMAEVKRRYG